MERIRHFFRALFVPRELKPISRLEVWSKKLSPSDWMIVSILGIVMAFGALAALATVSSSLAIEVPARGGTFTEGLIGAPRFINPLLAVSDTDRDITALVFSGLMKAEPDGSFVSDLAESFSLSEDKRTYTFTIKDGAQFHDGSLVTADDVAFTVRAAQNPDIKSPRRANWEGVEINVLDEHNISFTLKSPYAPFIANTTLGILPRHIWGNISAEEFPFNSFNTEPVGSGPYEVSSVKKNASGIPTEYHFSAFTGGVRTPYISTLIFTFYSNSEELELALQQGSVKSAHSVSPAEASRTQMTHEAVFARVFGVFFNQNQNEIFAEQNVRAALDVVLDKQSIVDTVLSGYGSVIYEPLPPDSTSGHINPLSHEERLSEARALLDRAGWKQGEDGIYTKTVKKDTRRLSFSITTGNAPELKKAAELVANEWRTLGAEIEVKFFEQNDLNLEVIRPRKYDALLFGLVVGRELDLFAFWHSSQRNDPGLNIALYANSATDKALESARAESDPEKRLDFLHEAAHQIADETAAVFLYAPYFVYTTPSDVSGITLGTVASPSDRFMSVEDWYLKTENVWSIFTNN